MNALLRRCVAWIVVLLLVLQPGTVLAQLAQEDWDIANGHFFSQTGGGSGRGYAVTDDDGGRFWSEFRRLGGVDAVGYPASQRFHWEGFTVQVFQRVVFQWRPEVGQAYFINVFDRLHEIGKDDWLLSRGHAPRPRPFDDAGKTWDQVIRNHLAVLDAYPAIRAKYYGVVGDPIQANGLPTSDVLDMGPYYSVRAQRVVFQQWKSNGVVTVALGGDIAKEAQILPDPVALQPVSPPGTPTTPAVGVLTGRVILEGYRGTQQSSKFAPPRYVGLLDLNGKTASVIGDRYTLSDVPYGPHLIYAVDGNGRTTEPQQVNVQSRSQTFDVQAREFEPTGFPLRILRGQVVTAAGDSVEGAIVWRLSDPTRTATGAGGRFNLVSNVDSLAEQYLGTVGQPRGKRATLLAVKGDRWGYIDETSDSPPPSGYRITLDRTAPMPVPPVLVYDLIERAPQATWNDAVAGSSNTASSDVRALPWSERLAPPRGFAGWLSLPELEDGSRPSRALATFPRQARNGQISGRYAVPEPKPGEYFVARFAFLKGSERARATFKVHFVPENPAAQPETPPLRQGNGVTLGYGATSEAEQIIVVAGSGTGQRGHLILTTDAGDSPDQDSAVWVEAQIVRRRVD